MDDTMDDWWRRPSMEGRPDCTSRKSTEKGLGLDENVSKSQHKTYPKFATMILGAAHRSR